MSRVVCRGGITNQVERFEGDVLIGSVKIEDRLVVGGSAIADEVDGSETLTRGFWEGPCFVVHKFCRARYLFQIPQTPFVPKERERQIDKTQNKTDPKKKRLHLKIFACRALFRDLEVFFYHRKHENSEDLAVTLVAKRLSDGTTLLSLFSLSRLYILACVNMCGWIPPQHMQSFLRTYVFLFPLFVFSVFPF